jgi:3'-5' exoribonuclease
VAPHTLEALIVHHADDLDAKFNMMVRALAAESTHQGTFTSKDNPLRRRLFRGL